MDNSRESFDSDASDVQVSLRQRYPQPRRGWLASWWDRLVHLGRYTTGRFYELSPLQRIVACVVIASISVLMIVLLIFHQPILTKMDQWAHYWRGVKGGWILLWFITCATSIPPLSGYSYTLTMTGFIYGFPNGWFVSATATVLGSAFSFFICRRSLSGYVQRVAKKEKRFEFFSKVLHNDDFKLLCLIRLCPLPFSWSNGALATLTNITLKNFALATAIITPKLLLHIFVGAQVAAIGDHKAPSSRSTAVHYISIGLASTIGLVTAYYVYNKAKAVAAKAQASEAELEDDLEIQPSSPFHDNTSADSLERTTSNSQRRNSLRTAP